MKKHIRLILTICLALCMVLCLGLAVACQPDGQGDNTFTITVLDASGAPVANQKLQYCAEGDTCTQKSTDSNGKVTFDISTDKWKESPTVHVQILDFWLTQNGLEGYQVYNAAGTLLDYDDVAESYDDYVDHHTVESVTYTLKKIDDIYTGYQYDVINFSRVRTYSTYVETNEAYLDVDVNGGQFDLSVKINGVAAPGLSTTLSSTNNSVHLEDLGGSAFNPVAVEFTVTPKNADSDHLTLSVCPVYEIGAEEVRILANHEQAYLDIYKVYFSLSGNAELAFSSQEGDFSDIAGYSIKVTIGTTVPVTETWTAASDISFISVSESGCFPVTFEFDDPDTANLALLVTDVNISSDVESDITLGADINVSVTDMFDGLKLTFIPEESGNYVITITGDKAATVSIEDYSSSETYFASEYEGVITVELEAHVVYTFTFSTDDSNDTYTAVVTKGEDTPDDPSDADITLGESFEVTLSGIIDLLSKKFYAEETGTYLVTIDSEHGVVNWLEPVSTDGGKYVYEIEVSTANKLVSLFFTTTAEEGVTFHVTVTKKA